MSKDASSVQPKSGYGSLTFVSANPGANAISIIRSHAMLDVRRNHRQDRLEALKRHPQPLTSITTLNFCKCLVIPSVEVLPSRAIREQERGQCETPRFRRLAAASWPCPTCGYDRFVDARLTTTGHMIPDGEEKPVLIPFLAHLMDPFHSFIHPTFKLKLHHVREIEEVFAHLLHFYSPGPIKTVTIPTAQNDLGMLMSMLFMGLANLSAKKNRPLSSLAMLVKGEAMREINQKMNDTEMARHPRTLSSIVYLSSGIRTFRATADVLEEVAIHENGLTSLVKRLPGRVRTMSNNPAGATLAPIMTIHHLCNAALLAKPFDIAYDISENNVVGFNNDNPQESPLYRLSSHFYSISASKLSSSELLEVINASYDLIDLVCKNYDGKLSIEQYNGIFSSIQARILGFPTTRQAEIPSKRDYIYKSCRLACLIMLSCVSESQPFSKAPPELVQSLLALLKLTDVGDNWGDLIGVFFWVLMVGSAPTQGKPNEGYADSLLGQTMLHMCFHGYSLDSAMEPPKMFGRFHRILAELDGGL